MLGKGLESLIPKKNQQAGGNQSAQGQQNSSQQAQSAPTGASYQSAPAPPPPSAPVPTESRGSSIPNQTDGLNGIGTEPALTPAVGLPTEPAPILPTEPAPMIPEIKPDLHPAKKESEPESRPQGRLINHPEPARQSDERRQEAIFHIEVDKISSNPHQPRQVFEEEGLRELASSIREYGVLQPIIVSKVIKDSDSGTDVEYELIAGERRLMASKLVGLRTIPAIIRRTTPEREKLEIAIIENIQRRNLDPIEEARAYTRLQDEFKLTQREIAAKLGKSREAVANSVRLLNLPTDVQEAISKGRISESQGRLLLSLHDIGQQQAMFREILASNLSVREIKAKIARAKEKTENKLSFVNPESAALQEKLEEFLGTKVELKEEGDRGKIMINFYSKEELRGILDKLFKDGI